MTNMLQPYSQPFEQFQYDKKFSKTINDERLKGVERRNRQLRVGKAFVSIIDGMNVGEHSSVPEVIDIVVKQSGGPVEAAQIAFGNLHEIGFLDLDLAKGVSKNSMYGLLEDEFETNE